MSSIILKPKLTELYTLNEFILNELQEENLHVNLIVEEVFVNIIKYSKADFIKVNVEYENETLIMKFIDNGIEFNPLLKEKHDLPKDIDEAQIGGLGIFLTKQISDELYYNYIDGENHLKIIKKVE
ncbi:ATP-binding protein [Methanobrevibacter millerae]|uniref:Anti-sigma regulatory factor serine/threonine protein kinase n=1 Tax=Methanobrevibacter millerae TaxID=230361 RepID=A0A0U3DTF8_9EURY|nr:ATP-binding protein [Methanobrevibacter millerae]ALT69226.1 anti-sigma regulatory factor serine/threonine protein kinase [Methanobrevibacter millerae]